MKRKALPDSRASQFPFPSKTMATIGDLSVSSIEEAFGLNNGDLKLVSDDASSQLLTKNRWTPLEGLILRATRIEVIGSTFISNVASTATRLTGGVFEFEAGGRTYHEYLIHNLNRLYNNHIRYDIVAYVNEGCRLLHPSSSSYLIPITSRTNVEKMKDLVMCTIDNEKCKEGEVYAAYLEGPNHGEYENYKTFGNLGKFFIAFEAIDMDTINSCSPEWLRQRKEQINDENVDKIQNAEKSYREKENFNQK